jgi:hypothetical protein
VNQLSLLDKGLTYIPTYKNLHVDEIYEAQHRLIRSLKLRDHFFGNENPDFDFNLKTFTDKSTWTPADHLLRQTTLDTVQEVFNTTESVIRHHKMTDDRKLILRQFEDNLSPAERSALIELKNNASIVIKPADKGSATVIMDKSAYVAEAQRQLTNTMYYRKLSKPTYVDNIQPINDILDEMAALKVISPKQLNFLQAKESDRQRIFYLLPKIHKPRTKWPQPDRMPEGRPIVSDCGSESYRISQYIDSFIRPISIKHPSYIKDTYDFVNKIRNQNIPSTAFLVTGDVTALYTNMQIDRTIDTVRMALTEHPVDGRPDRHIIKLLEITLRNNDFVFNEEFFLQICGTAMGKTYAPGLADLYLEKFDRVACNDFFIKPLLYFRFLDDTFFVWTGSLEQLREYELFLNQIIPGITITLNVSPISVNFLDTTVFKKCDDNAHNMSILLTKVYFKETDTHQLLHKDSFHPQHTAKGVLKSQILRFQRISSTYEDFSAACKILFQSLAKRKYSSRLMRKMKVDIWQKSLSASSSTIIIDDECPTPQLLPIVVPFNEIGTELAKRWRLTIEKNVMFNGHRLITAYKTGRNLRKNLVRSLLGKPTTERRVFTQSAAAATTRCTNIRCIVCSYMTPCSSVRSHTNCHSFKTIGSINCKSCNVIYLISCKFCNQQYVGETSRALADRVNTHLSCIRTKKETPVALHFNMTGHCLTHFTITGIELMASSVNSATRKMKESTWQNLLQTAYPLGINNLKKRFV